MTVGDQVRRDAAAEPRWLVSRLAGLVDGAAVAAPVPGLIPSSRFAPVVFSRFAPAVSVRTGEVSARGLELGLALALILGLLLGLLLTTGCGPP